MDGQDDMQPASARKLTYEDFLSFPDDGQRHELIDGVHYVTPSPATRHQRVSRDLLVALATFLNATGIGEVFAAPFDVVFSNFDIVEPDLLVILADQSEIVTDKHVRGAPAIVVEILSPGTRRRDEGIKRRLYERSGVREYWVIDPDLDSIVVEHLGPDAARAAHPLEAAAGDALTSSLLPGFSLRLLDLFSKTDR